MFALPVEPAADAAEGASAQAATSGASASRDARERMWQTLPIENVKDGPPNPLRELAPIPAQGTALRNAEVVEVTPRCGLRGPAVFAAAVQGDVVIGDVEGDAVGQAVDGLLERFVLEGLEAAAAVAHQVVMVAGAL